ncbi:zinc finger protein 595-like [Labeo rohita]|uniref:Zinc finger protein 595-like n=1 Tax=Labeo rohita TaxID=84645 RepID=A0A498M6D9_LABRO|nr:zinc finger protein 595-like [Labeo rohita]
MGQTIVLEAAFEKDPDDKIDMVTWDRERGRDNVRLSPGNKISLEKRDALLRVSGVAEEDFGTYKVTVTDSNGYQQHDSIEVRKIVEPLKASVTRVLECIVDNHGMTQWDSPQYSWLVDGVTVTNQTALLANGSRLDISEIKGVNYTCIVKSSLGTVTTHFQMPKGLWSVQCLSVRFTNQQSLYVIKGQNLILQAQIELLDGEHVAKVTWDHAAKTSGKTSTIAEFPRKISDERVTLEQQGATLKINGYQAADAGIYTVTVTDQSGLRRSAQRTVQEYRKIN